MSQFVESIKLKDGEFFRLPKHQERVNKAFATCLPTHTPINLREVLNEHLIPQEGIYKCRIVYNDEVQSVEIAPYVRREIRSLQLVETDMPTCAYKQEDRTGFNTAFAQRGTCDDVLLVKNGLLTDTSYSNVALFDGQHWFTPRVPLLYGTNRAELLENKTLIEKNIAASEIKDYQQIALFNAMVEFGEVVLGVEAIVEKI